MKVGFASQDITPAIGMERAADYMKTYIDGIATPLCVRAAVFDSDKTRIALVGVDCCVILKSAVQAALQRAEEMYGLRFDSSIIAATHTHSGAVLSPFFDNSLLDGAPDELRDFVLKHSPQPHPLYLEWCISRIASALQMADRNKEEALISTGTGIESGRTFNRRFIVKGGRTVTHPGKMHPDIIKPAGPVDPAVGVISAWRPDGTMLGCIVNYSCHATCDSGLKAHGDWPYY
ncbi:MAG: hypothetical protein PHT33_00485, partial [bacterium]|nr:hypothetical protein [bacterium]